MARTALTVIDVALAGTNPHPTAANVDGHSVTWARDLALVVRNSDASGKTVTLDVPNTLNGLTIPDRTVAVASNGTAVIPLGASEYRQVDGTVFIDYSAVTSVTVGVIRLPNL